LFGSAWAAVAPIFAVLAIGGIFRSIQQIAYWTYLAKGKTGAQLRMILLTRPIMIVIIVAGIPWGPLGVAVGHSVAYFLFWLVSMRHVGKVTGVNSGQLMRNALKAVLLVCAPAGVLAWTCTLLPIHIAAQGGAGLVAAFLYMALIARFVPTVRADAAVLFTFIKRALRRSK
jgi:O-antigen/teichoic acid export membrane protein